MDHCKCFLFSRPLFPLVSSASSPWLMGVLQVAHGSDLSCLLNTSAFPSGQRGTSQACAQTCPSDGTLFLPNSRDALLLETMEARRFTSICITSHILCYCLCPQPCIWSFLPSQWVNKGTQKWQATGVPSCKAMWLKWMEQSLGWSSDSDFTVTYLKEFCFFFHWWCLIRPLTRPKDIILCQLHHWSRIQKIKSASNLLFRGVTNVGNSYS